MDPGAEPRKPGRAGVEGGRFEAQVPPARPVKPAEGARPALADQHGAPPVPAFEPGEECGEEGGRRRPVPGFRACRLVESARRQPPLRQGRIQSVEAEPPRLRQPAARRLRNGRPALQKGDPPPQSGKAGGVLFGVYGQHEFIICSIYG